MQMPNLLPFPIKTQNHSLFNKLWNLFLRKRQWQVTEDWHYVLPNKKIIIIPKGFIFDGSSYSPIVWLFFSPTGLLLIPVILHDFCFTYDYLWAKKGDSVYKFKPKFGFYNWCALIRKVGIERNELRIIDYFVWVLTMIFGWLNWIMCRRKTPSEIFPQNKD